MAEHTKRSGNDKRTADKHSRGERTQKNADKNHSKKGWVQQGKNTSNNKPKK